MTTERDEPVSYIFLSCDLTGSTNFKQQKRKKGMDPWQKVFLQFYREFPQRIATTQKDMGTSHLQFKLWKPIGDELIFSCEVSDEQMVIDAVRTWLKSMADYEKHSLDGIPMGTKGGAFIATFPGPDSRSSVPRVPFSEESDDDVVDLNRLALKGQKHEDYVYDYFGPSIDTGFRVIGKCTPRYFTLSVEVALAFLGKNPPGAGAVDDDDHTKDLMLLEFVELKGVWKNQRYPVIAIDIEYGKPVNRAYRKFESRGTPSDLHELCKACYHSGEDWPSKLYLPRSWNSFLKEIPKDALADYVPATMSEGAEEPATEPENAHQLEERVDLGILTQFDIARAFLSNDHLTHGYMPNGNLLCGRIDQFGNDPHVPNMPDPDQFDPDEEGVCIGCQALFNALPDDYPYPDPDSLAQQGRDR